MKKILFVISQNVALLLDYGFLFREIYLIEI